MAWPPNNPPGPRANLDPQLDSHPEDHTWLHDAVSRLVKATAASFSATRSGAGTFSVANSVDREVRPGTELFAAGGWSASSVFYIYNGPEPILVEMSAGAQWQPNPTGVRRLSIKKNGNEVASDTAAGQSGGYSFNSVTALLVASPGDQFAYELWQNSGGALDLAGTAQSYWSAHGVAPVPT